MGNISPKSRWLDGMKGRKREHQHFLPPVPGHHYVRHMPSHPPCQDCLLRGFRRSQETKTSASLPLYMLSSHWSEPPLPSFRPPHSCLHVTGAFLFRSHLSLPLGANLSPFLVPIAYPAQGELSQMYSGSTEVFFPEVTPLIPVRRH